MSDVFDLAKMYTMNEIGSKERKKLSKAARKRMSESAKRRWGDPIKRFWSHVDKSEEPDGCWTWMRSTTREGYGRVLVRGVGQRRADKVAWQITHGEIPERKYLVHKCNNKLCVNPEHLFLENSAVFEKRRLENAHHARWNNFDPVANFWTYVDKSNGPDACWIWIGFIHPRKGYGTYRWKGRSQQAHRAAWEIIYSEIPKGKCVLHHCDNPKCVNPKHLWIGTNADNMKDMRAKGRQAVGEARHMPKGEAHHAAKLNEKDVREIRRLATEGVPQKKIAQRFNITHDYVGQIARRKVWKHIS